MTTTIEPTKIDELCTILKCPVLRPGDDGYDESRRVWNGMIDRHPPLVVQPEGNADVIDAVNFARENGLAVSVKGGGHSAAGSAVSDDALMIDLSLMGAVHVDPKAKRARAQGGATWRKFDRECQLHGLASTGGVISSTGVGGLTLGGGLGWLMGKYGLSVDNLVSVDVVTADGRLLTASESENDDLFWAVRGGSGNFGIVTSFEFQLHDVGPMVTGGLAAWPLEKSRDVLEFYKSYTDSIPDELTVFAAITGAPDGSGNLISVMIPVHCGPLEDGARAVQPIKDFGPPMIDNVGPIPYVDQQSMLDAGFPHGAQVYWKSAFLKELTPEAIDVIVQKGNELPTPLSSLVLEHFHGAATRVPVDATAVGQRSADFNLVIASIWQDPADAERCTAWARGVFDAVQPFATGDVYLNYLGVGDEPERVKDAYGPNYDRLARIKHRYDPDNLFRANQNIAPKA